jgi:hypothetical protein
MLVLASKFLAFFQAKCLLLASKILAFTKQNADAWSRENYDIWLTDCCKTQKVP